MMQPKIKEVEEKDRQGGKLEWILLIVSLSFGIKRVKVK